MILGLNNQSQQGVKVSIKYSFLKTNRIQTWGGNLITKKKYLCPFTKEISGGGGLVASLMAVLPQLPLWVKLVTHFIQSQHCLEIWATGKLKMTGLFKYSSKSNLHIKSKHTSKD